MRWGIMFCCAGKVFTAIVVAVIAATVYFKLLKRKRTELCRKHVVITGGSSGIGKALAILIAKEGAHVTIIARNKSKLENAENQIRNACINLNQKITSVSVDVSDYKAVKEELEKIEESVGPIFGLVNCAGFAICGKVEDLSLEDIQSMINVNYLGSLYPTQLVVPKMKERKEGFIALTASQVALMGMFGYSVYSSCKFALRGLAESIDMELRPYNISVTLALPPDTDTPGFENENKTKPLETKLLSEVAGLYKPEQVARKMLEDILDGRFLSCIGFESLLLTTLCVGMTPFSTFLDVLFESLLLGPFRIISAFYIIHFQKVIKNCIKKSQ